MKSQGVGFLLAFFFGPLGLLYSTVVGAIVMLVITIGVGFFTFGFGALFMWPICWIVSIVAVKRHNESLRGRDSMDSD